jgi:hypothetical protein
MKDLIAPTQSAFIKGRNLVDGVLVVNELVDLAKKQRKRHLIPLIGASWSTCLEGLDFVICG